MNEALAGGANPNASDEDGMTALALASRAGEPEAMAALIAAGARCGAGSAARAVARGAGPVDPLSIVSEMGRVDLVMLLLVACEPGETGVIGTDRSPPSGWRPIQWAAFRGHQDVVEALAEAGADLDIGGETGEAPLSLAIQAGHTTAAITLANLGADPNTRLGASTPLHHATAGRLVLLATSLLAAGADVERLDGSGRSPIQLAFDEEEDELLKVYYCEASPEFRQQHGAALTRSALAWGDADLAGFFEAPGCEAGRIGDLLRAAGLREKLTDAARVGDAAGVAARLAEGALPESRDRHGATALLLAASEGSRDAVDLLVTAGAGCSTLGRIYDGAPPSTSASALFTPRGMQSLLTLGGQWIGTPLTRASMKGHLDVVHYLLENCVVDVDEREWASEDGDQTGLTSLQRASLEGQLEVVELLLANGANVDGGGLRPSPVLLAARRGHLSVVQALLRAGASSGDPFELRTSLLYLAGTAEETLLRQAYCSSPPEYREAHAAALREVVHTQGDGHMLDFLDDPDCDERALDDLVLAFSRLRQAEAAYRDGRFGMMEDHSRFALDVRERVLGENHPDVAEALNSLAIARLYQGDYASALSLHERALEIRRTAFTEDARIAITLNNLGFVYAAMGDYGRALPLYEASLRLREQTSEGMPGDLDLIGTAESNLADVYLMLGDAENASRLHAQALETRRDAEAQGSDNAGLIAESLLDLADSRSLQGRHAEAESLADEAIEMLRPLGEHVDVAQALSVSAGIQLRAGETGRALRTRTNAYSMRRRLYGAAHPTVAEDAARAAEAALALGLDDVAAEYTLVGLESLSSVLSETLETLSVAEQSALLERHVPRFTNLVTLLSTRPEFPRAYNHLLSWKGALLRGIRLQKWNARLESDAQFAESATALRRVRTELGAWFHQAGRIPAHDWVLRNDSLSLVKERLERELATADGAGRVKIAPERSLETLTVALADDEALVDVYRIEEHVPEGVDGSRYAAVIVLKGETPRYVDLGPATLLDEDIAGWLDRVDRLRSDREIWTVLREDVWEPILVEVPAIVTRIWVSPDGALARIPWNLFDGERQVSTVGSASDIVELRAGQRAAWVSMAGPLVAVGGVDFDADLGGMTIDTAAYLPALPGTADEVARIAELGLVAGRPVRSLTGDSATTEAFTGALSDARYLHIATHGFFFDGAASEDTSIAANGRKLDQGIGFGYGAQIVGGGRNPLVETGLAFAGANRLTPDGSRALGRLTAEELIALDLSSIDLVTLSACDTGRGREVTGQGVIGLQSAFSASGARSVLMSLWKVDDESTAMLMNAFYHALWNEGLAPAAALRRAQEAVRDHPSGAFSAPAYWAAWTLAGEAW